MTTESGFIKFNLKFVDQYGDEYESNNTINVETEAINDVAEMEEIINCFMRQIGYVNFNKDRIILESVSDEEYERMIDALHAYRKE